MSTVSLRVIGDDKLQTGFNKFALALAPVTREAAYHALELASKKSPGYLGGNSYIVPESGYVRTGNLGRSVQLEQEGLSSRITVQAYSRKGYEYGHLAVGDAEGGGQAANFAAIGWVLLRKAVDEQIALLTAANGPLEQAIGQESKKAGL